MCSLGVRYVFGETSRTSETSRSFGSLKNSCTFAALTP
nr:MAG TPA: hypothetical protein [Bacteriophage sp.]